MDDTGALIDRGANGGVGGKDMCVIAIDSNCRVHVQGLGKHQLNDIPITSMGGVALTSIGPAILIFH